MSTEQAFLQDITAHPEDDTPRLVCADWLQELGDPPGRARAAFIRTQVQLRHLPPDDPLRPVLAAHERILLAAHGQEWASPVMSLGRIMGCQFRGGFVERIALDPRTFVVVADRLFAQVPVREVGFVHDYGISGSGNYDPRMAAAHLTQINGLDLRQVSTGAVGLDVLAPASTFFRLSALYLGYLTQEDFQALPEHPWLPGLDTLQMSFPAEADRLAAALLRLPHLTCLDLSGAEPRTRVLRVLERSHNMRQLHTLRLGESHGAILEALGRFPPTALPALSHLDLAGCRPSVGQLDAFLRSPLLPRLRSLNLSRAHLGGAGLAPIASSHHLANVRVLDLSANEMGPEGAGVLATATRFRSLRVLHLRTNRLGQAGLAALTKAPWWGQLTALDLSYNQLGPEALEILTSALPPTLRVLDLTWNPLGDVSARNLARPSGPCNLQALDLGYTEIGDASLRALADSSLLTNLTALNLFTNGVGDEGIRTLTDSGSLRRLEVLDLGHNHVGHQGGRVLADSTLLPRLTAVNLRHNRLPCGLSESLRPGN